MEGQSNFVQNKKALIGGVVVIVLVLFVSLFSIFSSPSKAPGSANKIPVDTLPIDSNNPDTTTGSNPPPVPTQSRQEYKNSLYSFIYPQGFNASPTIVEGNAGGVVVTSADKKVKIEVQIYNTQNTSIDKIDQTFKALGYKSSDKIISGEYDAREYEGELNMGEAHLHESAVVVEYENKIYKLQMTYNSPSVNLQGESAFDLIISTFKFL